MKYIYVKDGVIIAHSDTPYLDDAIYGTAVAVDETVIENINEQEAFALGVVNNANQQ